jgi:hypothetical protein
LVSHPLNLSTTLIGQGGRPTAHPSTFTSGSQPLLGPFGDALELELSDRRHDMKNQASGWCRSVDVLGQRPKARPSVSDRLDDYQKVLERSAQAIVFRDNYNVTGPQLVKETVEFRPIQLRAGDLLTVDPFSPGRYGQKLVTLDQAAA